MACATKVVTQRQLHATEDHERTCYHDEMTYF